MTTRRGLIVMWGFLAVCACSESTGTRDVAARDDVQDGSGALMNTLLAWQRKNLPMEVTGVRNEAETGGRTVSAEIRNESDVVCTGGWGTDDTSPLLSFGPLTRGAAGSAIVTYPGGQAALAAELRLECAVQWTDVPSMTGLSAQEVDRLLARYSPEKVEENGVVFSLRWSPSGTWVEVNVNGRLAVVAAGKTPE
jgi:hypothetical protein